MPQWRYRVHRWEVTDTAAYTQTGWFTQERRIAPLARVQTVDVRRGPVEQLFGLANVTVTTASAKGPIVVHALDRGEAEYLVHWLTERTRDGDGT
ncbi:MAG: PH domain-containing protein [Jatrophihabitans endophyticus]|nr:PH domain-containing protein [Jatrophihabitans endophyticus]